MADEATIAFGLTEEHLLDARLPDTDDEKIRRYVREHRQAMGEVLDLFEETSHELRNSGELTAQGRKKAFGALRSVVARRIEEAKGRDKAEYFREKADRRRTKVLDPERRLALGATADVEVATAEVAYRRDRLLEMDETERKAALMTAVEEDDVLTLRAIENAPSFAPIVDPGLVEAAAEAHARERFPDTMAEVDAYEEAADRIAWNTRWTVDQLVKRTGDRRFMSLLPTREVENEDVHDATAEELLEGAPDESGAEATTTA